MSNNTENKKKSGERKRRPSLSENEAKKFSERVAALIEQKNLPQAEIAMQTGISRSAISNIANTKNEKENGNVSLAIAIKLARYFGVSLDYLCGLTDCESSVVEAFNLFTSQVTLSEEKTESGQLFSTAKISKPIYDYFAALKLTKDPHFQEAAKDIFVKTAKETLTAAISDKAKHTEQDMKEYLIIERTCDPHSPAFERALDEYLQEKHAK